MIYKVFGCLNAFPELRDKASDAARISNLRAKYIFFAERQSFFLKEALKAKSISPQPLGTSLLATHLCGKWQKKSDIVRRNPGRLERGAEAMQKLAAAGRVER
jgi:hypothetical protein